MSEHELVKLNLGSLDYFIRKNLDIKYLRDMAQMANKVWQVERLKAEKARSSKYHKKEKVAYVEVGEIKNLYDVDCEYILESEVNMIELKQRPPYICKLLKPSNGKNLVEPKNEKFVTKTYMFGVTKCDEIFDLLVFEGQMIILKGLKTLPLEQGKKN